MQLAVLICESCFPLTTNTIKHLKLNQEVLQCCVVSKKFYLQS